MFKLIQFESSYYVAWVYTWYKVVYSTIFYKSVNRDVFITLHTMKI